MTHLLTVKACEQTPGDSAIMAEFPGVFTTGTQRVGVPGAAGANKRRTGIFTGRFYRRR